MRLASAWVTLLLSCLALSCDDAEPSGEPAPTPAPAIPSHPPQALASPEAVAECEQALNESLRGSDADLAAGCRGLFVSGGCRAALERAGGRQAAILCIRDACEATPSAGWAGCTLDLDHAPAPALRDALAEVVADRARPHLDDHADQLGAMVAEHLVPRPTVELHVERIGATAVVRYARDSFVLPVESADLARALSSSGPECPDVLLRADDDVPREEVVGLIDALGNEGCDRVVNCRPELGNCP